jgi:hypothetical protein
VALHPHRWSFSWYSQAENTASRRRQTGDTLRKAHVNTSAAAANSEIQYSRRKKSPSVRLGFLEHTATLRPLQPRLESLLPDGPLQHRRLRRVHSFLARCRHRRSRC